MMSDERLHYVESDTGVEWFRVAIRIFLHNFDQTRIPSCSFRRKMVLWLAF